MAENIKAHGTSRAEKYKSLLPQLTALLEGEKDLIANMANIAAVLKTELGFFWVGFYIVKADPKGKTQLVLGPFQGPVACTRIDIGKGVCGSSWAQKRTIVVEDVDKFPGHIACSSQSRSEIVIPGFDAKGEVRFVLDVDSDQLNDFNQEDAEYLGAIIALLSQSIDEK
jgi:GAF domain-containing protein